MARSPRTPLVGLALGGGSARGWAHIGVIRALDAAGVRPDLVCGTSIGALVGAAWAAGELERFTDWVLAMRVKDVVSFVDLGLSGGFLKGDRLMDFVRRSFVDRPIEDLPVPFGAVATALQSGSEVWLRRGSTVDAVRASIALPALFTPVIRDGVMLVDGGLVNPVPVSLARAMGAELVIAVDLSSDLLGRHLRPDPRPTQASSQVGDWLRKLQDSLGLETATSTRPRLPSMLDVVASSLNVMQVRIARSRLAGDPADALIAPRLAHLGLLDFHRAREAIEEGKRAVESALPSLRALGLAAAGPATDPAAH
ncbi:patatin-like phospholipase family protein [Candidatus Binatia bacterium]|nr:patatin-like phospholipase family protein [Candidatus Binatia bacterium]